MSNIKNKSTHLKIVHRIVHLHPAAKNNTQSP